MSPADRLATGRWMASWDEVTGERSAAMAAMTRVLAGLSLLACLVLVAHALLLGLHFEDTPRALADAERGRSVGYPAAIGALAALVALVRAGRRWAAVLAVVAAALAVVALAADLTG